MRLSEHIHKLQKKDGIALMTHLVLGYSSFEKNWELIENLIANGVGLLELQIPFTEPSADGPSITKANIASVLGGTSVDQCLAFVGRVRARYPEVEIMLMSYANILYARGFEHMITQSQAAGACAWVVPDLPPEEGEEYRKACKNIDMASVFIMTPKHSAQRLQSMGQVSTGMVYGVLRSGVTGEKTALGEQESATISEYQSHAQAPLGIGFGISSPQQVKFLRERGVNVAILGSAILRKMEAEGAVATGRFCRSLLEES